MFKFVLIDYVFFPRSVHLQILVTVTWLYLLISFFHFIIMCGNEDRIRTFDNYIAIGAIYMLCMLYTKMAEAGAIIIGCPCTLSTDEEGCMHACARILLRVA